jgi:hypothetical protein
MDFADLPAEFLTFSGLFFHQAQNIDIQRFVFELGSRVSRAGIGLGRNLMVWHFFDVKNSAAGWGKFLILRLSE